MYKKKNIYNEITENRNLIIYYDKKNNEIIYHDNKNKEPLYIQYCPFNNETKNYLSAYVIKDIRSSTFIGIKKAGSLTKEKYFSNFNDAFIFISDLNISRYQFEFYKNTITHLENKTHPFFKKHVPYFCFNLFSGNIYKGISYFNILYKNIENKNECSCFISKKELIEHKINSEQNNYEIPILIYPEKEDDKEFYENIVPINKTDYFEKITFPSVSYIDKSNSYISDDKTENKIFDICNQYINCLFKQKEYVPEENNYKNIIKWIKLHPYSFIKIIEILFNDKTRL